MNCLFCESNGPYNTLEHIIPESLGNDEIVLEGHVCDKCQNYFGKEVENWVLSKTPIGVWRIFLGIKNKKGNLPTIDLSLDDKNKGKIPYFSVAHDNLIGFSSNGDGSAALNIDNPEIVAKILSGEKTDFKFVLSPMHLFQIGRFLGKIGIELICAIDPELARSKIFDNMRKYSRQGLRSEIWPIFHAHSGDLGALIKSKEVEEYVEQEVICFEHDIKVYKNYWLLRFKVGTDNWIVCLNNAFPHPEIRVVYPSLDLNLVWYEKQSWEKK